MKHDETNCKIVKGRKNNNLLEILEGLELWMTKGEVRKISGLGKYVNSASLYSSVKNSLKRSNIHDLDIFVHDGYLYVEKK